jgi:hypothetical protein
LAVVAPLVIYEGQISTTAASLPISPVVGAVLARPAASAPAPAAPQPAEEERCHQRARYKFARAGKPAATGAPGLANLT